MITTSAHDIQRLMEDSNLFGPFQRQPATSLSSTYRSSDLLSLPPSQYRTLSSLNSIPPSVPQYKSRAASEILQNNHQPRRDRSSSEAEAIDKWFENIQRYEQMLEEVADASLDQGFKDELQQINQWFRCRSDAERTAAFYTVLQNASQIQIRFLITVLQQLAKREPYPAGQETASEIYQASTASYQPSLFNAKSSVISAGSEYESPAAAARRRQQQQQLYPFSSSSSSNRYCTTTRQPHHKLNTTTASAISEPDDIRRRQYYQRDIFSTSRPLGLSNPGPLYEKALAARAQIQALNSGGSIISGSNGSTTSGSSTTSSSIISSSSLSSSDNNAGHTGGLFSSPPPRLRTSCSTTDISPSAATTTNSNNSLFVKSNDWPFPLTATGKNNRTLSSSSTTSRDSSASWAFGSLRASSSSSITSSSRSSNGTTEKKGVLPWSIQEEEQPLSASSTATSTMTSRKATGISASLSALEQAQARLRQQESRILTTASQPPPPAPSSSYSSRIPLSHSSQSLTPSVAVPTVTTSTTLPSLSENAVSKATTATPIAPYNGSNLTTTVSSGPAAVKKVTLLTPSPTPPSIMEATALDDYSDGNTQDTATSEEKPLTGLARRRKRSSAARALKDKIAAETVDFELMKDVQMWLRTLRLHKYGHAFVGLNWQQVIRMSDQDMEEAGVNTIGARRKLLKVFENVQKHCIDHNIEY